MATEPASERLALQQGHYDDAAAHALFAAIAQIGVALHESQQPVAVLGGLLAHLAETLCTLRSLPSAPSATDSVSLASARRVQEQLKSDVFKAIQQLQFYDRMVQHLTLIQAYLISVANESGSVKTEAQAREFWAELHAKLRKRLISDEQRGLLDVFLSPQTSTRVSPQARRRPDYSPPGSFEMF